MGRLIADAGAVLQMIDGAEQVPAPRSGSPRQRRTLAGKSPGGGRALPGLSHVSHWEKAMLGSDDDFIIDEMLNRNSEYARWLSRELAIYRRRHGRDGTRAGFQAHVK